MNRVAAGLLAVLLVLSLYTCDATEPTLDIAPDPPAPGPPLKGASAPSKEAGTRSEAAQVPARPAQPTRDPVIEGRVVDTRLRPVGGGRVRVIRLFSSRLLETADVGEDGRFRLFEAAVLSRVYMTYGGETHVSRRSTLDLWRGRAVELVVEALETLRVTVLDRDGRPFADARVHGDRRAVAGDAADASTDEEGRCDLLVGPGRLSVLARTDGLWYGHASVWVPKQREVTITLDRELAHVPVRLVPMPGSEHLRGAQAVLIPGHGIYPITRVPAVIGGHPVSVPLKFLDFISTSRGGSRRSRQIRSVGTLSLQVGEQAEQQVHIPWSQFESGRAGNVITVLVEDRRHEILLRLRDAGGNPVRRFKFGLQRELDASALAGDAALPRAIKAMSDEAGLVRVRCASGRYRCKPGPLLEIEGPGEHHVALDVCTFLGTSEPRSGTVRVVSLGRENADRNGVSEAQIEDGRWFVNVKGAVPGTHWAAQWMDGFGPRASVDVVAGGPPVRLRVESILEAPHDTRIRVRRDGALVWADVQVDSAGAPGPRIGRDFRGLRTFDLSLIPPGDYAIRITDRFQHIFWFSERVRVGDGGLIEIDLEDAVKIWDGKKGGWLKK